MKLEIIDGLPFVGVTLTNRNKSVFLKMCLVDTGSAGTVIPVETALELGLRPEWSDKLFRIHGIGGSEFVYSKTIEKIVVGSIIVFDMRIEVGAMDYGLKIEGILGMDFLMLSKAVIDFKKLELIDGNSK